MNIQISTENLSEKVTQLQKACDESVLGIKSGVDNNASERCQKQLLQPLQQQGQKSQQPLSSGPQQGQVQLLQQQQQQSKTKRKHRRGKPKSKNGNKPYKKTNWKFQMPRLNYINGGANGGGGIIRGHGCGNSGAPRSGNKIPRSRSLVPYNTNKFLMEEHLADIPSAVLTPTGRTRDSSFSMDSEDNYFFSLPEDEEEFLTKEFANVYEKARVERLESLSKQELIDECLQFEDRYSKIQGTQRQQQLNMQRIATEYMSKIRMLEEKIKELSRENHNLRCQLMRSTATAAAASPPSAAAPAGSACQPMDSNSEDSESDSSTSSSSSSSSSSNNSAENPRRRHSFSSSPDSPQEFQEYIENNYMKEQEQVNEQILNMNEQLIHDNAANYKRGHMMAFERQHILLEADVEDDYDDIPERFRSAPNSPSQEQYRVHEQTHDCGEINIVEGLPKSTMP
uniref:Protein HEXIM1 n=1 Tax=Glossina palpalis gambiensis TaxID=67801 RepID=A0A1B0B4X9_9MUSC